MNAESIASDIRKLIADKVARGEVVRVQWMTNEVIAARGSIDGEDVPFYRTCAYAYVREQVRKGIGKYSDISAETDKQILLPGFNHLQIAYMVNRNEDTVLVPVEQLSDEELLARAAEYEAMAKGCREHARELRKFISARAEARAA